MRMQDFAATCPQTAKFARGRAIHSSVIRMASSSDDSVAQMLEKGTNLVIEEEWDSAQSVLEAAYLKVVSPKHD